MGTTTKNKKSTDTEAATQLAENPMDPLRQLREIQNLLFGEQLTDVQNIINSLTQQTQQHFQLLEQQLKSSVEQLRQQTNSRIDELSQHLETLNRERESRDALIEDDVSMLRGELGAFQQQTEQAHDALEKQLFSEADKLAAESDRQFKELNDKLGNASADLTDRKADRRSLAAMFASIAHSLDGELTQDGAV